MAKRGKKRTSRKAGPEYLSELPEPKIHFHETRRFPEGFLWGTATSSHQVEGNNNNDWTEWEKVEGHIADGNVSGEACDQYHRYEEDFDLLTAFHQNAHRLSVEWSRIEPEEGVWDYGEVVHYRNVLSALKKRGVKVMLTAWHFTLPKWFVEKGGWEWRGSADAFARYVDFLAVQFGDLVDLWITINEPNVYTSQSYAIGVWPPGVKSVRRTFCVFRHLVRAHKMTYRTIHRRLAQHDCNAEVGIAKNVVTFEPYRRYSLRDSLFVWFAGRLFNRQFFNWTRGYHDFIGINNYFHYRVKYVPSRVAEFFYEVHTENREVSDLGWEINPEGIFEAIMSMRRYRLPIYITENGFADADDSKRPRMLIGMLLEIYHAIRAGADVRGYFHWSLLDNYEWDKGFSGRFGLIAVDFETQIRTPRRSAYVYADICKENGIPHDLLRFVGHGVRW